MGVDMAGKTRALRAFGGDNCFFLLKTFVKNSNRYQSEPWQKINSRISIPSLHHRPAMMQFYYARWSQHFV